MLVDRRGCLGYLVPANGEQGNDALPKTKETKMSIYGIWNEIAAAKPETIFRNVTLAEFRDFHWVAKDSFV